MTSLLGFSIALLASLLIVPAVRTLATRMNFVDRPDGRRKIQGSPIALGGGLAIFASLAVTFVALYLIVPVVAPVTAERFAVHRWEYFGWAFAVLVVVLAGIADDAVSLKGTHKLMIQIIASSMIVGSVFNAASAEGGIVPFAQIGILGFEVPLGHLGVLAALLWMLCAINSFNLIDGVDGLASTVGIIFSLTLGLIAIMSGKLLAGSIAFALAGATAGFLVFNRAPASIYLGDTGSMLIGLILGAICLQCSFKQTASMAFIGPLAIWAVPFFDSLAAVVRRKLTGRSIYATDRGHIHHVLLMRGLSANQTVLVIGGLCLFTCGMAIAAVLLQMEVISMLACVIVIAGLIISRVFGHVEFVLLNKRLQAFGQRLSSRLGVNLGAALTVNQTCQIQGRLQWEDRWSALVEYAERVGLAKVRLNLYIPMIHESFFAEWKSPSKTDQDLVWNASLPLTYQGIAVGRVSVTGQRSLDSSLADTSSVWEYLTDFDREITLLIARTVQGKIAPLTEEEIITVDDRATVVHERPAFASPHTSSSLHSKPIAAK